MKSGIYLRCFVVLIVNIFHRLHSAVQIARRFRWTQGCNVASWLLNSSNGFITNPLPFLFELEIVFSLKYWWSNAKIKLSILFIKSGSNEEVRSNELRTALQDGEFFHIRVSCHIRTNFFKKILYVIMNMAIQQNVDEIIMNRILHLILFYGYRKGHTVFIISF